MTDTMMETKEIRITVSREYKDRQDLDNVVATIPLIETYGNDGQYAEITAYLLGREWFPNRSTYGSGTINHEQGPKAFQVEIQPFAGSAPLNKAEAALKKAKRLLAKLDKNVLKPKTFGECVAVWSIVTGFAVSVIRPESDFGDEGQLGATSLVITDPKRIIDYVDGLIARIVRKKREALGLDKVEVEAVS